MAELMSRQERTHWEWVGRRERLGLYTPTVAERRKISLAEDLKRGDRTARRIQAGATLRRTSPSDRLPPRPKSTFSMEPVELMRLGNHLCTHEGWTAGEFQHRHDVPPPQ